MFHDDPPLTRPLYHFKPPSPALPPQRRQLIMREREDRGALPRAEDFAPPTRIQRATHRRLNVASSTHLIGSGLFLDESDSRRLAPQNGLVDKGATAAVAPPHEFSRSLLACISDPRAPSPPGPSSFS